MCFVLFTFLYDIDVFCFVYISVGYRCILFVYVYLGYPYIWFVYVVGYRRILLGNVGYLYFVCLHLWDISVFCLFTFRGYRCILFVYLCGISMYFVLFLYVGYRCILFLFIFM